MEPFIPGAEDVPDMVESVRYDLERGVLSVVQAGLKETFPADEADWRSGPFGV